MRTLRRGGRLYRVPDEVRDVVHVRQTGADIYWLDGDWLIRAIRDAPTPEFVLGLAEGSVMLRVGHHASLEGALEQRRLLRLVPADEVRRLAAMHGAGELGAGSA